MKFSQTTALFMFLVFANFVVILASVWGLYYLMNRAFEKSSAANSLPAPKRMRQLNFDI